MKKLLLVLLMGIYPALCAGQAVQQSGQVVPAHVACWITNGVLGDCGSAASGNASSFGITASGLANCLNSAVITASGWQQLCFGVTTAGGAQIAVSNFGTAPPASLSFLINNVTQSFPTIAGSTTINDIACFANTSGQLKDCGALGATTLTGDVTGTGVSTVATTIAANAVSNAKFRQSAGLSVVGTAGTATANVADITGIANQVLGVNSAGTALAFGQVNLAASAAVTGQLIAGSFPALTGDITTAGGALATTLATVNANTGSWGTATQVPQITVNGKGLITAAANVTVTPSFSSVTGVEVLAQLPNCAASTVFGDVSLNTPACISPSAVLDMLSTTQGTILYRDTAAWLALAPGTSGQLLQSGGAAANPSWATASGTGTVTSVASDGTIRTDQASNGPITATGTLSLWGGPGDITNCTLTGTVSGNALTVALKGQNGSNPSATNPCIIGFRNATIATGDYTYVKVTAATSFVTATSGDTFGSVNSTAFRLWITVWNNAGTVVLGVSKQSTSTQIFPLNEGNVQSSTACNACGTAASSGVFYTTAAQTSKAIRILGYMDWSSGLGTAGVWASGPTTIQMFGPGVKKPGDVVQSVLGLRSSSTSVNSASYLTTNITATITPTSTINLIRTQWSSDAQATSGAVLAYRMTRAGTTQIGPTQQATATTINGVGGTWIDLPQTTSATSYGPYLSTSGGSGGFIPANAGSIIVDEIQG